jgi:hypothetical protein
VIGCWRVFLDSKDLSLEALAQAVRGGKVMASAYAGVGEGVATVVTIATVATVVTLATVATVATV